MNYNRIGWERREIHDKESERKRKKKTEESNRKSVCNSDPVLCLRWFVSDYFRLCSLLMDPFSFPPAPISNRNRITSHTTISFPFSGESNNDRQWIFHKKTVLQQNLLLIINKTNCRSLFTPSNPLKPRGFTKGINLSLRRLRYKILRAMNFSIRDYGAFPLLLLEVLSIKCHPSSVDHDRKTQEILIYGKNISQRNKHKRVKCFYVILFWDGKL